MPINHMPVKNITYAVCTNSIWSMHTVYSCILLDSKADIFVICHNLLDILSQEVKLCLNWSMHATSERKKHVHINTYCRIRVLHCWFDDMDKDIIMKAFDISKTTYYRIIEDFKNSRVELDEYCPHRKKRLLTLSSVARSCVIEPFIKEHPHLSFSEIHSCPTTIRSHLRTRIVDVLGVPQ